MRPALLAAALLASLPASAAERQYRTLTLVDGRTLHAEILSTEPQGLLLQMPQGRALVSFELLQDMVPTDVAAYDTQEPWKVWIRLPEAYQPQAEALLDAIPGIDASRAGYGGVSAALASDIIECEDIDCIAMKASDTEWKWIIVGTESSSGDLEIASRTNKGSQTSHRVSLSNLTRDDFWYAFHDLIELQRPAEGAPKANSNERVRRSASADETKVIALSFVPVPGLPSMLNKDGVGAATAFGIVVPSTAVWIAAVGQTGQSGAEFGALSFIGYYAATVVTNQVTGLRSLEKNRTTVTVAPGDRGGAALVVSGGF